MIQLTAKNHLPIPAILQTTGDQLRQQMIADFQRGMVVFTFDKDVYGDTTVKQALQTVQHHKCCFCESRIGHIDDGDVEHFRPKKAFQQAIGTPLLRPGYFWLAYEWSNLFLACTKCNQRNKRNLFPLITTTTRVSNPLVDVANEDPIFIDPTRENPEVYISFQDEYCKAINQNTRGSESIKILDLNRSLLIQNRLELLDKILAFYEILQVFPDNVQGIRTQVINKIASLKISTTNPNHQYSAMFRAFFNQNQIPDL